MTKLMMTNEWPQLLAVSMTMAVRRGNIDGITQCSMSRATPEATRPRHQATARSVLPQRPPGQQANKQQSTNTPTKLAVLMAMAMRQYVTVCIAQWRRSRASLEATGRCHRASIMSNNINRTWLRRFFYVFIVKTIGKGHGLTLRTLFLIGVWHIKQKRRAWLRWVYNLMGGLTDRMSYARVVIVLRLYLLEQCLDPVFWTSI